MRIAFVSDAVYPWNVGGLETLESTEAKELAKNHEVHFFSFRWPGMKKDFKNNGIQYHTFHNITKEKFYRHGRRSIREALVFTVNLFRLFGYRFDYLQANEFPVIHLPVLKLYCKLTNCKLILDVHEVWRKEYWTSYLGTIPGILANAYASTFLVGADAYIANSTVTEHNLINLGIEKEKVHLFTPVIDDEQLKRISIKKEKTRVIFAGRLIKEKRIDKWIKVIKSAQKRVRNLSALIIGDGPEKESLEKLIKRLKLKNIVELHNFYEDKTVLYKSIKESKLLLHMSEREGLSIIVLESIALGTPVLLPTYSPIPKEVKELCITKEEIYLTDALVEILNSDDKSRYLKNKERIAAFSISKTNSFYKDIFDELKRNKG